ncbi:MAG: twin-arginine translocation signal domain-containing protein [Myxococcota bacterium]
MSDELTRREFLQGAAGLGGLAVLGSACGGDAAGGIRDAAVASADTGAAAPRDGALADAAGDAAALADARVPDGPTPQCAETEDDIEGPYYRPGAPFRDDVNVRGDAEMPLVIRGHVLGPDCVTPLAGALLDVWQADADGVYDNASADFHLRGRFYADGDGQYAFTTVLPGLYPGRTRHIHLKANADGHVPLTTQIYFAGEPANAKDAFIDPALIIPLSPKKGFDLGIFDVVLAAS